MERSINTANRDTVLFVSFAVWLQQIQIKVSILEINVYFWKEPYTRTLTYSISECHMLVNSIEIIRFASACANTACRCVSCGVWCEKTCYSTPNFCHRKWWTGHLCRSNKLFVNKWTWSTVASLRMWEPNGCLFKCTMFWTKTQRLVTYSPYVGCQDANKRPKTPFASKFNAFVFLVKCTMKIPPRMAGASGQRTEENWMTSVARQQKILIDFIDCCQSNGSR